VGFILRLHGIAKTRQGGPVLQGVDLEIRRGEVMGLIGANGTGKSTLLSIVAGLLPADVGTMSFLDQEYHPLSADEARAFGVGIVEQSLEIDPHLTVAQAIFRHAELRDSSPSRLRRAATLVLNDVGLRIDPDARIGALHRAQVGLVECVRLLAEDAYLVIIDEVGSTFNAAEIEDLRQITSRLTRQGRSVLYVSHRLHEVQEVSDRIAVLRDGVIVCTLDAADTAPDEMWTWMFGAPPAVALPRRVDPDDEVVLHVRGLSAGKVDGIDFDLHRGEVLGICGPRGAGVESVLSALIGDHPGAFGELLVKGQPAVIDSPQSAASLRIAIFADDDANLGISREESVARSLLASGWGDGTDFETEARALREVVGMLQDFQIRAGNIFSSVGSLSGGDRQKVALMRFLASDIEILVMHEPTRNLDAVSRDLIHQSVVELLEAGRSALLVSSDLAELLQWSDRVLLIDEGRIQWELDAGRTPVAQLRSWLRDPGSIDLSDRQVGSVHLPTRLGFDEEPPGVEALFDLSVPLRATRALR
jgi:ABC-type sugar transport system ATPase subunit